MAFYANYVIRKIDPELWKEVKGYTSFHGLTIGDLVVALLKGWVEGQRAAGMPTAPSRRGKAMPWKDRPAVIREAQQKEAR